MDALNRRIAALEQVAAIDGCDTCREWPAQFHSAWWWRTGRRVRTSSARPPGRRWMTRSAPVVAARRCGCIASSSAGGGRTHGPDRALPGCARIDERGLVLRRVLGFSDIPVEMVPARVAAADKELGDRDAVSARDDTIHRAEGWLCEGHSSPCKERLAGGHDRCRPLFLDGCRVQESPD